MVLTHNFKKIAIHHLRNSRQSTKNISFAAIKILNEIVIPKSFGEYIIVLLKGKILIKSEDFFECLLGPRHSVFKDKPHACFIPAGIKVKIQPLATSEAAFCFSLQPPKTLDLKPFKIQPKEVKVEKRGMGHYKRKVINILDEKKNADYLIVGETLSNEGMWSSYPPHKHDRVLKDENKLEEIYYYKMEKENRFAFQSLYSKERNFDIALKIYHNDVVKIPFGYHPVSAPPDSKLYYLWVLSGKKRFLKFKTDTNY